MHKFVLSYRFEAPSVDEAERFASEVTEHMLSITDADNNKHGIEKPAVSLVLVKEKDEE